MWQMDVVKSTMANKKIQKFYAVIFLFCYVFYFYFSGITNRTSEMIQRDTESCLFPSSKRISKLNWIHNNEKWQSTLKCQICYECLNVYLFRCKFFFSLLFSVRCPLRVMVCSCDVAHSHGTMRLNYNDFVLNLNAIHWPPSKY